MPFIGAVCKTATEDDVEELFLRTDAEVIVVEENLSPGSGYETRAVIFSDVHSQRAIMQVVSHLMPIPFATGVVGLDRVEMRFDYDCSVEQLCEYLSAVVEFVEKGE